VEEAAAPAEEPKAAEAGQIAPKPYGVAPQTAAAKPAPASTYDFPYTAVGGVAAVVGALGLLAFWRRRSRGDDDDSSVVIVPDSGTAAVAVAPAASAEPVQTLQQKIEALDNMIETGQLASARLKAQQLLRAHPNMPDLNVKLLDVLYRIGDGVAFEQLAGKLAARGFSDTNPELWAKVERLGAELLPESELFGAPKPADAEGGDVFDAMLSELESGLAESDAVTKASAADELGEAIVDLSISDQDESASEESVRGAAEELTDLEYDFGSPAPVEEEEAVADASDNVVHLHGAQDVAEDVPTIALDTGGESDEVDVKLDLARAFLDLGDNEGARGILEEVIAEGNAKQREQAEGLLKDVG